MKRSVAAIILMISVLFVCSCGDGGGSDNNSPPPTILTPTPTTPTTPSTPPVQTPITVTHQLNWVSFSPYLDGQDPNRGSIISEQQLRDRLAIIKPYTLGVRSFGSTSGLEKLAQIAKTEFGLKTAIGAWLSANTVANDLQMANLIAAAKAGWVDIAIIGSETLLRNDLSESALLAYIAQFRAAAPGVLVTTADVYGVLLAHPNVLAACDLIFANFYPYWEGVNVKNAAANVHANYLALKAKVNGKEIYVSETGWPSDGNTIDQAVPNLANAATYFLNIASWAQQQNVKLVYFEAFDETWKAANEGPQGAYWGIFTKDGVIKAGMQAVFDGNTATDNWSCGAPVGGVGTPQIEFTSVPPKGSTELLRGQVWHVISSAYAIAVYIKVAGGWWTKPYWSQPLTVINCDGTWVTDVTTGGADTLATDIAAYLIPRTYVPPIASGGNLPTAELNANSSAHLQIAR